MLKNSTNQNAWKIAQLNIYAVKFWKYRPQVKLFIAPGPMLYILFLNWA